MSAPVSVARSNGSAAPPRDTGSDPWQALVQVGAQFVAALAAANDPDGSGASLDRARSGHRRAKPQNAAAGAGRPRDNSPNALSALADSLRGKIAVTV